MLSIAQQSLLLSKRRPVVPSGPPSIRGKAIGTSTSTSDVVIAQGDFDVPPQPGDLVVAFMWTATTDLDFGVDWGAVTGFIERLASGPISGSEPDVQMFAKIETRVAGGSEGSYTFSPLSNPSASIVQCIVVKDTGGMNASPPAALGTVVGPATQNAPSITTTVANCLYLCGWMAFWSSASGSPSWTSPGGVTEQIDTLKTAFGQQLAASVGSKLIVAAGATGTQQGTVSRATPLGSIGTSIALAPAA